MIVQPRGHAVLPRAVGMRDQGKPDVIPYRYGYAKAWAVKRLGFQKQPETVKPEPQNGQES